MCEQQSAFIQLESAALYFQSTEMSFENENFNPHYLQTHVAIAASFLRVNSLKLELQTSVMQRKI